MGIFFMEFLRGERVFTVDALRLPAVAAHPTTPQALSAALRTPVDIVNQVLTFLTALGILLGLWMCLSARQGGFAL
jgi:hypothetical protein